MKLKKEVKIADDKANTGKENSGDFNSGHRNSGHWNSGDRNSGDWNSGDRNSGYLNTDTPKLRIFNKETDIDRNNINYPSYFYFDLTEWIEDESKTEGGYLKVYNYKEAWKISFEKASKEDVAKTLELPNFDYALFEEISGITKEMIQRKLEIKEDACKHTSGDYNYCPKCGFKLK